MDEKQFLDAIEGNLFEAWRYLSVAPEVDYQAEAKMIRFISGIDYPLCNSIMRTNFSAGSLDEDIRKAMAPFVSRRLPMLWWVGPGTRPAGLGGRLGRHGLKAEGSVPGMAADLHLIGSVDSALPGFDFREVKDKEGLGAWIDIFRDVFEVPSQASRFFSIAMARAGFGPGRPYRHFLGCRGDKPVACSSVFMGESAAGIYNVAVAPEFRGRGVGAAMTLKPLDSAREAGLRTAILHSSEMGLPVYKKLGFREYCRLDVYLWQPE
ncbi:MAG: GNAT family N-acetyltransferase [Syntrophales bacterium]|nr:GNAT family N-acetyltransferase [Syntrophales bacterium]MDD5533747.1 GNAT family N-acetyltransferase [Syntrophales bacterium]